MSLVLRFIDSDKNITEEFIGFLQCKWVLSGVQLSKIIVDALNDLTLRIDDCGGQGYDGVCAVAVWHTEPVKILNFQKLVLYSSNTH